MRALLVIDNATLDALSSNAALTAVVPCLAEFVQKRAVVKRGCRRCNQARRADPVAYNDAKRCLGTMHATLKAELKRQLQTEQVRIEYMNGAGRGVRLTF